MLVFWRHGYEATSLTDLTKAMGVTPPSIYAAYGDKKGLFLRAVQRYLTQPVSPAEVIAQAPTAREAARLMVEGSALAFTGEATPPGCLLASSAIACSDDAADVREELASLRRGIEACLRDKIAQDVRAGAMAADTDAETLAAYVTAVIQGLSTLARDGAPREKLIRIAQVAMAAWP
ncbi:MAG: TetR/AcrR family transcriptional regulator [Janthinobacterium lividum]